MTTSLKPRPVFIFVQAIPDGEFELVDWLIPQVIDVGCGGGQVDQAQFEVDLVKLQRHVQNVATPTKFSVQVQIWFLIDGQTWAAGDPIPDESARELVFAGSLIQQHIAINDEETAMVTARRSHYDFGKPLSGFYMPGNTDDADEIEVHEDIVFNPELDGAIVGNMSPDSLAMRNWSHGGYDTDEVRTFFDPDEPKITIGSDEFQKDESDEHEAEEWTVAEAVRYLCATLNPDQRKIKNPTQMLYTRLDGYEADELLPGIKNLTIPRGMRLPNALDRLLGPQGCDWYLRKVNDEEYIEIEHITEGPEEKIYMQAIGSDLELAAEATSNEANSVRTDIGNLFNHVLIQGGLERREVAIELEPVWPDEDDDRQPYELQKKDEYGESLFQTKRDVWRKWTANESGIYTDFREQYGHTEKLDLTGIFRSLSDPAALSEWARRPRKFENLISTGKNGETLRPQIEYYDTDEEAWKLCPSEWGFKILKKELGIYCDADEPPALLMDYGIDSVFLRVIGSIVGDHRLTVEAPGGSDFSTSSRTAGDNDQHETSPNGEKITLQLDLSDVYQDYRIVTSGDLQCKGEGFETSVEFGDRQNRNDYEAAQAYADSVLGNVDAAGMLVDARNFGLSLQYRLMDRITEIFGRGISLNAYSKGFSDATSETRYPYVIRILWYPQAQITHYVLSTEARHGL